MNEPLRVNLETGIRASSDAAGRSLSAAGKA
jgi:hypothetical protein